MTKSTFLLVFFLIQPFFFNSNLQAALTQTQFMTAFQTIVDSRVLIEQLREYLIKECKKKKSFDLQSLQMLLDYYGIQKDVKSKNEAIELILKCYHEKQSALPSSQVLVLSKEIPKTASISPKFDFRVQNEAAGFIYFPNSPRGPENYPLCYQGQNVAIGIDMRPISGAMSWYEQVANYEARRSWAQFCIEHNGELRFEYQMQRARCVDHIKRMLDYSSNLEALGAQLSVNNLYLFDAYDEGAILCDWVKPGIQNLLFKDGNFVAIDSQEKLGKLLEISDRFLKVALSKEEYVQLLQEYKTKGIPTADILLKRALGINGWWDAIKCSLSESFSSFPQPLDAEIANSPMVQNCTKALRLCEEEKFDEARKIVASLSSCSNLEEKRYRANEAHYLSLLIENEYSAVYNSYGIRYSDTADPHYAIAKNILDLCPHAQKSELQAVFQEAIAQRRSELDVLLKHATTLQKELPIIKAVAYKIIDAQNSNEIVDILLSCAKDHTDEQMRVVYSVFVSKGLPVCISANECAKQFKMPAPIELMGNEEIRKWYGYCAQVKIESAVQKDLINRAFSHLARACTENDYRHDHLYMAQRFYEDAVGTSKEKIFLEVPSLTHVFANPIQNQLQNELLKKVCDFLRQAESEKEIPAILEKAQRAWEAISAAEVKNLQDLDALWAKQQETAVLSGTSEIYPEREEEIVEEQFIPPYGCGNSLVDEITRSLLDFTEELFDWEEPYGGICFPGDERAKNLYDPESQEIEEQIDVDKIPQCNGGQQTLPSFGESAEEAENKEKSSETEEEVASEDSKEVHIIEEIINEALKDRKLTEEQLSKVEEFKTQLSELIKEYDRDTILEALEVYKLTLTRICKNNGILALKKIARSLIIINKEEEIKSFKFDAARAGQVTTSSIEEAVAGKACMDQGILEKLVRATTTEDDFVEVGIEKTINWDVKTPRSESLEGKYIFNVAEIIESLKDAYEKGENLIIQIDHLNDSDLIEFYNQVSKSFTENEFKRTVIVHSTSPEKSKRSNEFVKYMKEKNGSSN